MCVLFGLSSLFSPHSKKQARSADSKSPHRVPIYMPTRWLDRTQCSFYPPPIGVKLLSISALQIISLFYNTNSVCQPQGVQQDVLVLEHTYTNGKYKINICKSKIIRMYQAKMFYITYLISLFSSR